MSARTLDVRTPGPWVAGGQNGWPELRTDDGTLIARTYADPRAWADAVFIARACNAHDDLVRALFWALPYAERAHTAEHGAADTETAASVLHARAALAKAGVM